MTLGRTTEFDSIKKKFNMVLSARKKSAFGACDTIYTPDRRQSKTLLTIDERGSKIARNSVFDCHLSPVGRQMAVENPVSNNF